MNKRKFGFTLGEVLMTLGVIGIIAAMTMPVLVENVNESKYRSLLKSFYSKYSVNLDSILTTAGEDNGSSPCDSFDCFNDITASTFVTSELFNAAPCTSCSSVTLLPGTIPNGFDAGEIYSLANGMTMNIMPNSSGSCSADTNNSNFTATYGNDNLSLDVCALVIVDVNGNKRPNNFHQDQFAFYILSSKDIKKYAAATQSIETVARRASPLLPLGLQQTTHGNYNTCVGGNCNNTCNNQGNNKFNCTAEVVDGEGFWKRRDYCWTDNNGNTVKCDDACINGKKCFKN